MSQFHLRRLLAEDAALYRQTRLSGLYDDPAAFSGCYDDECRWSLDQYATLIGTPEDRSAIFGAFDPGSGDLVGIVGLHFETAAKLQHKATVWGMYTIPQVRGTGVARMLMAYLLEFARQQPGLEHLLLIVTASNTIASRWYDGLGFKLYGIETRAVKLGASYEDDELRMLEL